jgi:hypothetical protein
MFEKKVCPMQKVSPGHTVKRKEIPGETNRLKELVKPSNFPEEHLATVY